MRPRGCPPPSGHRFMGPPRPDMHYPPGPFPPRGPQPPRGFNQPWPGIPPPRPGGEGIYGPRPMNFATPPPGNPRMPPMGQSPPQWMPNQWGNRMRGPCPPGGPGLLPSPVGCMPIFPNPDQPPPPFNPHVPPPMPPQFPANPGPLREPPGSNHQAGTKTEERNVTCETEDKSGRNEAPNRAGSSSQTSRGNERRSRYDDNGQYDSKKSRDDRSQDVGRKSRDDERRSRYDDRASSSSRSYRPSRSPRNWSSSRPRRDRSRDRSPSQSHGRKRASRSPSRRDRERARSPNDYYDDDDDDDDDDLKKEELADDAIAQLESALDGKPPSGVPYSTKPEEEEPPIPAWTRSSPADIYFQHSDTGGSGTRVTTQRMQALENKFEAELVERASRIIGKVAKEEAERTAKRIPYNIMKFNAAKGGCCSKGKDHQHKYDDDECSSSSSYSDESDDEEFTERIRECWMSTSERRAQDPRRLHENLWFNVPNETNDGPICRCSVRNQQTGIRHNKYPGEKPPEMCDPESNNKHKVYHYQVTVSPHTNFLTKSPTTIEYDDHEFIFEGFSLFTHYKIEKAPICRVIRFNIEYTIHWIEAEMPENISMRSMDLFTRYLYREILELVDLDWLDQSEDGCQFIHMMPRFARTLPDNGKELLSMNEILQYMLRSNKSLIDERILPWLPCMDNQEWLNVVDELRGSIVTYPGKRPSSLRVDQLDRTHITKEKKEFPKLIHFGIRPVQLSYAGDSNYQKLWKQYMKFKHLLMNKEKISAADKNKLKAQEDELQELRLNDSMKREMTVELSSEGFFRTGLRSDVTQHALLFPVLISHLRFHRCLFELEKKLKFSFKNRILLQLALTHPSYRMKFGTNADHARNSLTNCGIRQLEYGDRRIHYVHTRKRGINTLFFIMSKLGCKEEVQSEIFHYERLEFLGDAIVEFLSSIHLFYMFPSVEEGGLTMYRTGLVQNRHLTKLASKLNLQDFMLYAHGPDLCRDSDLKHAMANCFEALMGALFIDGGIDVADRVFSDALFGEDEALYQAWTKLPLHPLQEDEKEGDRHWITSSPPLQKLLKFEEAIGVEFNHIRLLAKAFTMRNVGYNNLTMGHNQRLEFLGDTILQLITSEYLFKYFPDHHEGHLSLLRSSLVNNWTQSVVCDDLGMTDYIINMENKNPQAEPLSNILKMKDRADLVEAFLGALFVDKGLAYCKVFCEVCFYPRLKEFIKNQDWNDPKSQLQQCCLTLRGLDEENPDIPTYRVLDFTGPTNTRKYTVAVYFKRRRLAKGVGHSIQEAEMKAAQNALQKRSKLFPLVRRQRKLLATKFMENPRDKNQPEAKNSDPRKGVKRPFPDRVEDSPRERSRSVSKGSSQDEGSRTESPRGSRSSEQGRDRDRSYDNRHKRDFRNDSRRKPRPSPKMPYRSYQDRGRSQEGGRRDRRS